MNVKKAIAAGVFLATCTLLLTACTTRTTKSYTFDVDTGDRIRVSVETSQGYDITSGVPFSILKDKEEIMRGKFGDREQFEVCRDAVEDEESAALLAEGTKDGYDYFFCAAETKKHTEYGYFLRIGNTTVALTTTGLTQDEAQAVFDAMEFTLKSSEDRQQPAASGPEDSSSNRSEETPVPEQKPAVDEIDLLAGRAEADEVPGGEILSSEFTIQESPLSRTFGPFEDWEAYTASMKTAIEGAGYAVTVEDGQLSASEGDYGFTYEPNSAGGQYREARFLYWGEGKPDPDRFSKDLAWFTGVRISPEQIERCLSYALERRGGGDSHYVLVANEDDSIMFHVEARGEACFVYLSRVI